MTNDKREFVPRVPWEILNSSLSFAPSCTVNVTRDIFITPRIDAKQRIQTCQPSRTYLVEDSKMR